MSFDWFTFFAQIINFLILLFLLQRFLYRPITTMMAEREAAIAKRLEEARKRETEAETLFAEHQENKRSFEAERHSLLEKAQAVAEANKRELTEQARLEVEIMRQRWHDAFQAEQHTFLNAFRRRAGEEVFEVTRKILADLADEDLEQKMIHIFIKRITDLDKPTRDHLLAALSTKPDMVIRSAFPLANRHQEGILNTLKESFGRTVNATFQTVPELMSGLELNIQGHKLAWNIDSYLQDLESELASILSKETNSTVQTLARST